jgi:hypothetical protein
VASGPVDDQGFLFYASQFQRFLSPAGMTIDENGFGISETAFCVWLKEICTLVGGNVVESRGIDRSSRPLLDGLLSILQARSLEVSSRVQRHRSKTSAQLQRLTETKMRCQ